MNKDIKKIIAVSVSILIALAGYYGSYLPMQKSVLFIAAMQKSSNLKTISDFEQNLSVPLDAPSPIGQEELVRNMSNTIANSIQGVSDPKAVDELVRYVESYFDPIIARGRGMSFGQDMYILGMLNEVAFIKTKEPKYLSASEKYFKQGVSLGPKRPQGLYGLVDVYRMENNVDGFKSVVGQILSQWPDDTRTKGVYDEYMKLVSQSSSTKK